MQAHYLTFLFFLSINASCTPTPILPRRALHQPLFPASFAPPPGSDSTPPPPPPPSVPSSPANDQPFFHESPSGSVPDHFQPPPSSSDVTSYIPQATQPSRGAKTATIAISVGIVTLGMLSALSYFIYRHRSKHSGESQKLVGGSTGDGYTDNTRAPPSSFLYIGTVEPSRNRIENDVISSPYRKLNSIKMSDRYRPSPELQPLPPLSKPPAAISPSLSSSSYEDSRETSFHTPQCSSVFSHEDGKDQAVNHFPATASKADHNSSLRVPHSKRTSPKSRLSLSSSKVGQSPSPPPPTPPCQQPQPPISSKRPKFLKPPSPPNLCLQPPRPPPPPPPPPPLMPDPQKVGSSERTIPTSTPISSVTWTETKFKSKFPHSSSNSSHSVEQVPKTLISPEKLQADEAEGVKPKLKPLHWDKVRATSDGATVWDQLKSSSFQVNEHMIESLFGFNSANPASKETGRKPIFSSAMEKETRVLDPRKSQNIAILLRALNVTKDEVAEALSDGNLECVGAEILETLMKMAPTKEEEIKLRDYRGDVSKLGSAERFLKAVLDIPFAFKRVEAMLYRANFDSEVMYLRKAFQTLEAASEELKSSRLFLKLLEAVLKTGNRMNVGTNRGEATAFKLETLLKLVDIKGTDGKTTLLHFVVQEIIRSECGESTNRNLPTNGQSNMKEDQFKKHGLKIVAGLSRDLVNVKKAANMDSDVLSSYVSKLEMGLEKVRLVLRIEKPAEQEKFFDSMNVFLKEAEGEIIWIKADEKKVLWLVKGVTEYFQGNAAKEEAHPFRIFMIVRDFLSILDQVCKEVGSIHEGVVMGSARSFRISSTVSLPVLSRYNPRRYRSSDEESSSS